MRSTDIRKTSGGRAVLAGVLVALVALAALTAPAAAGYDDTTTIHVNDDWEGTDDGVEVGDGYELGTNATASIQQAIYMAGHGDNIVVHDGTYNESIEVEEDLNITAQNESGATIRYAPDSPTAKPTVDLLDGGAEGGPTLSGFNVERVAADDRSQGDAFAQAMRVSAGNATVENNDVSGIGFEDASNAGITVISDEGATATDVAMENNEISGFGDSHSAVTNYNDKIDDDAYVGAGDQKSVLWLFESEPAALEWGADTQGAILEDNHGDHLVGDRMSIQTAIDAADEGDTITVEDGTYDGFTLNKSVAVKGVDSSDVLLTGSVDVTTDAKLSGVAWNDAVPASSTLLNITGDDAVVTDIEMREVPSHRGTTEIALSGDNVSLTDSSLVRDDGGTSLISIRKSGWSGGPDNVSIVNNSLAGGDIGAIVEDGDSITIRENTIDTASSDDDAIWVNGPDWAPVSQNATLDIGDNGELVEVDSRDAWDGTVHYMTSLDAAFESDQSPINDSSTLTLPAGAYETSSTLTVTQDDLTIRGAGAGETVVNTSDVAGYGISTEEGGNVSGLTVESLTVVGSQQDDKANYAFKLNPTTEDVELTDVAVEDSYKTGIDANGVDTLLLEDVTVSGTTAGNGISLADTQNVLVDGATVENNTWGGIALYTNDDASLQGTHNVTIQDTEILNNDGVGVYAQNSNQTANPFSNITVEQSTFENNGVHVAELDTSDDVKQSSDWLDVSEMLSENDFDQTVVVRADGDVSAPAVFSDVQSATGVLEDGDTVTASAGTYDGQVTVDTKNVSLVASDGATLVYEPDGHSGQPTVSLTANDTSIEGFTVERVAGEDRGDKSWIPFAQGIRVSASDVTVEDNVVIGDNLTDDQNAGVMVLDDESGGSGETVENVSITENEVSGFAVSFAAVEAYGGSVDDVIVADNGPISDTSVDMVITAGADVSASAYDVKMDTASGTQHFKTEKAAIDAADDFNVTTIENTTTNEFFVVENASIQDALDETSDGSTVTVLESTHDENVTVDTANVTLAGNNATLNGAVTVNADGVTVSDLAISGASTSGQNQRFGVYVTAGVGDVTVTGNNLTTTTSDQSRAILLGTGGSGDVTITDNHVEGWTTGAFVPVPDVTIENNRFVDNTAAIGGIEDGTVTVRENAFDGNSEAIGVGDGTLDLNQDGLVKANVTGYTAYYETIQQAVDNAVEDSTVEVLSGTYSDGATIDKSLTLQAQEDADVVVNGTIGFLKANPSSSSPFPDNVTIDGFTFVGEGDAINANSAGDNLTIEHNKFVGVTNATVHGGEDTGKDHVKTGWVLKNNDVQNVENGFRLWNTGDVTVSKNDFETLSGSAVSLIAVDGADVTSNTLVDTTKAGVYVEGQFTGAFDTDTKNVSIVGNTFDDAGDDANTTYEQASVLTGQNLANLSQVDVHHNAFLDTSPHAIYADDDGDATGEINARLNWFGSEDGPADNEVSSDVTYDPFLTASPGETSDELQQYGHDFVVPGGEPHAVGFPADVDATYGELFCDYDGVVYIFDAEHEEWKHVDEDRQVDSMDAVVVVPDEKMEIAVDYEDAGSSEPTSAPGETELAAGWNFVAAPQNGSAETAFAATAGGDVTKIISQYDTAESAPYGMDGDNFGTYTFDQTGQTSAVTPTVSPYGGYWVYASDDGSLGGSMYPGMTYGEMLVALNTAGGTQ